jgi:hypothetical protein
MKLHDLSIYVNSFFDYFTVKMGMRPLATINRSMLYSSKTIKQESLVFSKFCVLLIIKTIHKRCGVYYQISAKKFAQTKTASVFRYQQKTN